MVASEGGVSPSRLPEICRALARTESRFLVLASSDELQRAIPLSRLSLLILRDLENAVRVLAGLESAGYVQVGDWLPERLLDQRTTIVQGQPQLVLQSALAGRRYDEVDERAGQVVLGGVRVPVIASTDLQQLEPILRRPEP